MTRKGGIARCCLKEAIAKREPESPAEAGGNWLADANFSQIGSTQSNRRVLTRTHGGVAGKIRENLPMPIASLLRFLSYFSAFFFPSAFSSFRPP